MGSIHVTRTTPATPDAVWAVLDDFGGISVWSRGVAASRITNDIERGLGAERRCEFDAKGKQWVHERVTARTDDTLVIDLYETNAPLHRAEATIKVTPAGTGSRIDMTMEMHVKGGILAPALEAVLMKPNFNKAIKRLLADLDETACTVKA